MKNLGVKVIVTPKIKIRGINEAKLDDDVSVKLVGNEVEHKKLEELTN